MAGKAGNKDIVVRHISFVYCRDITAGCFPEIRLVCLACKRIYFGGKNAGATGFFEGKSYAPNA